jgi:hypothetical protein
MTWDPELVISPGPTTADRHAGDRYTSRGQQMAEESALAILDKLKTLPPGMAESFASSFAKGATNLLAQQDQRLVSQEQFPPTLPEPLVEETPLQYRKGKRRAMTGLEIAEERERDALRQRRRHEREAAALAAVDLEQERHEERRMLEADWVADTQLQLSQLSYLDSDHEHEHLSNSDSPQEVEGSQARPLEVLSDSEPSDDEPRRSGRVTKPTRDLESQQEQIKLGLIPAPGAMARARALNAKKKKNAEVSQLDNEFKLVE